MLTPVCWCEGTSWSALLDVVVVVGCGVEHCTKTELGEYFHVHVLTQGPVHRDLTLEWVSCTHELVRCCNCN